MRLTDKSPSELSIAKAKGDYGKIKYRSRPARHDPGQGCAYLSQAAVASDGNGLKRQEYRADESLGRVGSRGRRMRRAVIGGGGDTPARGPCLGGCERGARPP